MPDPIPLEYPTSRKCVAVGKASAGQRDLPRPETRLKCGRDLARLGWGAVRFETLGRGQRTPVQPCHSEYGAVVKWFKTQPFQGCMCRFKSRPRHHRGLPLYAPVAQLAEQRTVNPRVGGSNPLGCAILKTSRVLTSWEGDGMKSDVRVWDPQKRPISPKVGQSVTSLKSTPSRFRRKKRFHGSTVSRYNGNFCSMPEDV